MEKTIAIVAREDGEGRGAIFDHHCFRRGFPNYRFVALCRDEDRAAAFLRLVTAAAEQYTFHFALPEVITNPENADIIVIPGGNPRELHQRRPYEVDLLQRYRHRKPMLLICGGIYHLPTAFPGEFQVTAVQHHANARMVRLNDEGQVIHNTLIHVVSPVQAEPLSAVIFGQGALEFAVNSVHGQAVSVLPENFSVLLRSGAAVPMQDGHPRLDRAGNIMAPAECVEAFVTSNADIPPLLGVQYHAEAFLTTEITPHRQLLSYVFNWAPEIQPPEAAPEIQPPEIQPPEIQPPEIQPPEIQPPEIQPPEIQPPEIQPAGMPQEETIAFFSGQHREFLRARFFLFVGGIRTPTAELFRIVHFAGDRAVCRTPAGRVFKPGPHARIRWL